MSRKWDQGFPLGPHLEFLLLPFILSLSLFFAYFEYDFGRRYIRSKEAPDACFFFTFTACFLTRKDHSEERTHKKNEKERKKSSDGIVRFSVRLLSRLTGNRTHTPIHPSLFFFSVATFLSIYFTRLLFPSGRMSQLCVSVCDWMESKVHNGGGGAKTFSPPSFSSWRPCWLIRLLFSFCYFGFFCAFPSTWNKRSEDEPGGSTSSGRWFANG